MTKCFCTFLISFQSFLSPLFSLENPKENSHLPPSPEPPFPFPEQANVPEPNFFGQFLYMLLMLGLLIGFLFFVSWFLKRLLRTKIQQANTGSLIKIVESRTLSTKATIHILEIEGKTFIVAEGPSYVTHLKPLEKFTEKS